MVISPPFLPFPEEKETEVHWFGRAMHQQEALASAVEAQEGSFPISAHFLWHTGLHLTAPAAPGGVLPVRAIADGKVVYLREPTKYTAEASHPQNYSPNESGPKWSDNGCLILEHSTDIGTTGEVPTSFVYYSLTMHLSAIDPGIKRDMQVYRKDVLGQPGKVYGAPADIHLEICCDDVQIKHLIGRDPVWVPPFDPIVPKTDGRTDSVFGDLFIYLPAGTATSATEPKNTDIPLRSQLGNSQTLGKAQWVSIRYEKGQGYIASIDGDGKTIGSVKEAKDFEYDLYHRACALHKKVASHVREDQSCPSAWYELLRFGRNLGPDKLPANAAHWREIPTAAGTIWADLNSAGTCKFSDADFLTIADWNFFSDDRDQLDQRCQSANLMRWIRDPDPDNNDRFKADHLPMRIGDPQIKTRLRRSICKFPTEWDWTTLEARNRWVMNAKEAGTVLTKEHWSAFLKHCEAMCLPNMPVGYMQAQWRFHPQEFVEMMGRCNWLALPEFAQLLPRISKVGGSITWENATDRFTKGVEEAKYISGMPPKMNRVLNLLLRKYGLAQTRLRMAHFFSQCFVETGALTLSVEQGDVEYFRKSYEVLTSAEAGILFDINVKNNGQNEKFFHSVDGVRVGYTRDEYMSVRPSRVKKIAENLGNINPGDGARFKGRGLVQITGRVNYISYGAYRGRDFVTGANPDFLGTDSYCVADTAFKYWINAGAFGGRNISMAADKGGDGECVKYVTKAINGGFTHLDRRQQMFDHLSWVLLDLGVISKSSATMLQRK